MKIINLAGKTELDIYINPQRQRILREMALCGHPVTPKQLSMRLGLSPSAVQHHMGKLLWLGVVAQDHTEVVRGITAHYYRALPVNVRVGCHAGDELAPARLALIQNGVNSVLTGFAEHVMQPPAPAAKEDPAEEDEPAGDVVWGVSRLTKAEAVELFKIIRAFVAEHDAPDRAGDAWEYALIAYPAKENGHA